MIKEDRIEYIRKSREIAEELAAVRASKIPNDVRIHAADKQVRSFESGGAKVWCECESHWAACLVILAHGRNKEELQND